MSAEASALEYYFCVGWYLPLSQPESHHCCLNNRRERVNDQGQTLIGPVSDESDLFQNNDYEKWGNF